MSIFIPSYIKTLAPYKAGKPISELAREKGLGKIVKLASNENPLGASPKALEALKRSLGESHRYVDPRSFELTAALAEKLSIAQARIICGAGTDALLGYIIQAFSAEGDVVLTPDATFIGIFVNARKLNRVIQTVPLDNYQFDLRRFSGSITERTKIIYLANPNNPTGTMFSRSEFDRFLETVPDEVLVILDEAYFNYSHNATDYPDGLSYQRDNLIITRTFSKDFGLAGLRVGFAVGPEKLIETLYKVKLPFEPSAPAQQAALAALGDSEFLEATLKQNSKSLESFRVGLKEIGIEFIDSVTNFFLLIFPTEQIAEDFSIGCLDRGLILRSTKSFGAPCGVRINSGTDAETEFALEVMRDVYQKIKDAHPSQNLTSKTT